MFPIYKIKAKNATLDHHINDNVAGSKDMV